MIQANELRKGNLVLNDSCPVIVDQILDSYIVARTKQGNKINCQLSLIEAVAGKLGSDGLTPENYSLSRAKEILSNCVSTNACIKCLQENENEVRQILNQQL